VSRREPPSEDAPAERLRVLVYNVRGFRDGLDRVTAVVDRFRPDLLLLNESDGRLRLRRFARRVGMDLAADPWSPLRRRVKDAVLVRPPWRLGEHRLLRFADAQRFYPRGALIARIEAPGARAQVAAIHLGLRPRERLAHARELLRAIGDVDEPAIVGGDLNELPTGRAVGLLSDRLWDAWLLGGDVAEETFPAEAPTARIDYLFVSEGVRVERAIVPAGDDVRTASDHRPILAEVVLPPQVR
jgi:endonuclease/exonuclease/phosphatase family metal-dependent hydrolase